MLVPAVHGGAVVNAAWCLALTAAQLQSPSRLRLAGLSGLALLGSVSDGLFTVGWVMSSLLLGEPSATPG